MKAVVLKCPRGGQFHFGKVAPDENISLDDTSSFLHSDTLFSAIINTAAKIADKGQVDELIDGFDKGKWQISSGFYCLDWQTEHEMQTVYFLPKPAHYNLLELDDKLFDIKAINAIEFISKGIWEQGISPKNWEESNVAVLNGKFVVLTSELPQNIDLKTAEKIKIYHRHSLPKVFVHKLTQEGGFYYQTNIVLGDNRNIDESLWVHYYFLIELDSKFKQLPFLSTVIDLLQDEGIGGERSVGCGHITEVKVRSFDINLEKKSESQTVLLSLLNPSPTDLKKVTHYKVTSRGGRKLAKSEGTQLKRVKMITEGALVSGEIHGQLPELGESNSGIPFLRNGKAFTLPIHSKTLPDGSKS